VFHGSEVIDVMDAMTYATQWLIRLIDIPLGGLLLLPRDAGLLVFAAGTALLMVLARRAVTNQNLLHRCSADLRRLKQFLREARKARDKPWLGRLGKTASQIKRMQLAADLRLLVVALFPVAFLAIWASERFDFFPPNVGEDLVVRAYFPVSSIDRVTHMVPLPDLNLTSTAIQIVRSNLETPPLGIAEWSVRPTEAREFTIAIRHQGETAIHRLVIGRAIYFTPRQQHTAERIMRTEVVLERYLPLGCELGSRWIGLPPWMIGYLVLTLILVPVLKRLLRVA